MAFSLGSAVGYLLLDTSGFTGGFKTAANELKVFQAQGATAQQKMQALGSSMTSVGASMTKNVTLPLVGVGAAGVKAASNFESSMSQVQATMGVTGDTIVQVHGESVNAMEALSAKAKEMGATTAFSASEAADALNYLALAGFDTEKQIDALPSVLTLAAAGNMELAYASDLVTDSMSVLGLTTDDMTGFIDQMAKTASSSNTSVAQLGEAILVAGGQAKLAGMDTVQLNTALGILADNGIKGSEGGTMLRNVLKNLYTPTDKARAAMEELGVTTANADGSLRETQDVLKDLSVALDGLTEEQRMQAMANIFDTRTIAGANALLENCTDRWDELSGAIDNAAGSAEQMADTQLDNLNGSLTLLKSALEGAAISIGEALIPTIRKVAEFINKLVSAFNNLSEPTKQMIVRIGAIVAAIGPVLLIVGKLITTISTVMGVLGKLGPVISFLTSPIGLVIAAIAALVAGFLYLWNHCEGFREFWINLWENVKTIFQSVVDFIQEKIEQIKEFFANLPENIRAAIDAVVNWFQTLPERIAYWLGYALTKIVEWATNTYNTVKTQVPLIIEAVVTFFSELPGKVYTWLVNTIAKVVLWAGEMLVQAKKAGSDFVDGVINYIKTLPGKIKEWMQQAIDYLSGINLLDIGKAIMQSFYDGLKKIWDDLWGWLSGIGSKIASAFNAGSAAASSGAASVRASAGGGPGARVSGSYASGLDYVPRDMLVKVHEGESIRTKNQTSRDLSTGGGDTFIFNSPTALTPIKAAQEMKKTKQQLALGFR